MKIATVDKMLRKKNMQTHYSPYKWQFFHIQ